MTGAIGQSRDSPRSTITVLSSTKNVHCKSSRHDEGESHLDNLIVKLGESQPIIFVLYFPCSSSCSISNDHVWIC